MARSKRKPIDHGSRRHEVVTQILTGVFEGSFSAGQRMKVEELGALFGVSPTPAREALIELAGIGIVELQPNRGAVLRSFGPQQLREIYQVRWILESEATRCACGHITPAELSVLEEDLTELVTGRRGTEWSQQTLAVDTRLHELIALRCGSERLAHEIGRYARLYRILREVRHQKHQLSNDYQHMDENSEHLAVVRALSAGKPADAARAMADHIQSASDMLERDLFAAEEIASSRRHPVITETMRTA